MNNSIEHNFDTKKAVELAIEKLQLAIDELTSINANKFEIDKIKSEIEKLKAIPEDKVGICAVCGDIYDTRYSFSVCSDSCFRDKFM